MPRPELPYPVADHHARIAVVEQKIDGLRDDLAGHRERLVTEIAGLREQIVLQNGRVDGLEGWRDRARGAGAALLLFVPVVTSFLTAVLLRLL